MNTGSDTDCIPVFFILAMLALIVYLLNDVGFFSINWGLFDMACHRGDSCYYEKPNYY